MLGSAAVGHFYIKICSNCETRLCILGLVQSWPASKVFSWRDRRIVIARFLAARFYCNAGLGLSNSLTPNPGDVAAPHRVQKGSLIDVKYLHSETVLQLFYLHIPALIFNYADWESVLAKTDPRRLRKIFFFMHLLIIYTKGKPARPSFTGTYRVRPTEDVQATRERFLLFSEASYGLHCSRNG